MPRRRYNNQFGTITDNPLTSSGTTMNSAALASFPAVVSPDYAAIIIDPDTAAEEVVWITAHTASATSATIARPREGSTAVAHVSGAIWKHGPTVLDWSLTGASYLPPDAFRAWNAALDGVRAGTGIATVMGLGASIIAGGSQVTDIMTKGYWAVWRAAVIARGLTLHGDSFLPTNSTAWNPGCVASVYPATFDVSPLTWAFYGPLITPVYNTATTMPLMHYTHPSTALGYNARSARFWYFDFGNQDGGASSVGRTSHVNMDGAGDQTITALGDHLIHSVDFTGLTNTSGHVLNWGNQSGAAASLLPTAVSWYPTTTIPTTGVHFAWFGQNGGTTIADLIRTDGAYPKHRPERLIGPSNASAPFTPNAALSPPFAPDLCLIDIYDDIVWAGRPGLFTSTPNLAVNGASPTVYLHGLRRICQALRQKATGCDIVHLMPNFPAGLVSDTTPLATYQLYNAWHYYEAMFKVAQMNGHAFLNTDAEWGELGQTLGFLPALTDIDPHPNDAGMQNIADRIVSRLGL